MAGRDDIDLYNTTISTIDYRGKLLCLVLYNTARPNIVARVDSADRWQQPPEQTVVHIVKNPTHDAILLETCERETSEKNHRAFTHALLAGNPGSTSALQLR